MDQDDDGETSYKYNTFVDKLQVQYIDYEYEYSAYIYEYQVLNLW